MTRRCHGFTMVELLVVIAILFCLIGLLIPAMQSARESSRRAKCIDNLRQFVVAMHSYHTDAGTFPMMNSEAYTDDPPSQKTVTGWGTFGAHALLLPYIEQAPLYNSCNFYWAAWAGHGTQSYINQTVWNTKVEMFLCPSDTLAGLDNYNSYCGSIGTGTNPVSNNTNGIFANFNAYSISDVKDGLAHTIAVTEALVGDYANLNSRHRSVISSVYGYEHMPTILNFMDARANLHAVMESAEVCSRKLAQSGPSPNPNRGFRWAAGSPGLTMTNIIITPNSARHEFGACRWDCYSYCGSDFGHLLIPTSHHGGGVNVAFADASVHFIKDQITQGTWMSLGSRNGGELISFDSY